MEADWEVEIGPGAPIIDANWSGFIDLQTAPGRLSEIAEAKQLPALGAALLRINGTPPPNAGPPSAFRTSKCDYFPINCTDPDEMNASPDQASIALAVYIDLLPRTGNLFATLHAAQSSVQSLLARLRPIHRPCCRADLVLRRAIHGDQQGVGITAYLSGCGRDTAEATLALSLALEDFATALSP